MIVTSIPVGGTAQQLDGFSVLGNVPDAVRESVVLTDANDPSGIANVVSTQAGVIYGYGVWPLGTTQIAGQVSTFGVVSSYAVTSQPTALVGTSQVFGQISSYSVNIVSTYSLTSQPTLMIGTSQVFGQVSSYSANIVSTYSLTSQPTAMIGTSQVFGGVSSFASNPLPGTTQVFGQVSSYSVNIVSTYSVTSQPTFMVGTTFIQGTVSTQVVSSLPFLAIPTASSTGGTNSFTATLLANLNTTVVKAGPGTVYGIQGSNIGSSNVFVRMYQSSTAPSTIASSGVPAMIFPMPVSTNPFFECTVGVTFSSGISFITQQQIYTATTALAVLASTATITILYK